MICSETMPSTPIALISLNIFTHFSMVSTFITGHTSVLYKDLRNLINSSTATVSVLGVLNRSTDHRVVYVSIRPHFSYNWFSIEHLQVCFVREKKEEKKRSGCNSLQSSLVFFVAHRKIKLPSPGLINILSHL
jgi:hypothetical protein